MGATIKSTMKILTSLNSGEVYSLTELASVSRVSIRATREIISFLNMLDVISSTSSVGGICLTRLKKTFPSEILDALNKNEVNP